MDYVMACRYCLLLCAAYVCGRSYQVTGYNPLDVRHTVLYTDMGTRHLRTNCTLYNLCYSSVHV